jgi:tetratricopeptide (TPR) repeat protein
MKDATERPIFRALINVQAAALAMARGRPLKAEAQLRTALEIFDELGDVRGSVNARANLATALIRQLRIPEARAELESVLAAAKGLREHRVAVTAACNLASLAGMTGDHEAARAAFSAAIDELAGIDDPDLLSQITVNHAVALHQLGGREEEAADQFRRGAIIARRSANSSLLVTAAEGLAEIAWREGDLAAATESYERVMVTSDASGQPAARSRSRGALAALAAETGDDAGATHLLVDALGLLPEGDPRTVAWLLRFGSRVWAGRDPERAARLLGACDAAAARSLISDWSDQQRQQLELEVRAKLGDLTSDLIEAGRTLSEDEALALARP